MFRTLLIVCLLLWVSRPLHAAFDIGYEDDADLTHFVTRPEIKAPLFHVEILDSNAVDPGYWFVGPYAAIVQETHPKNYYQACQTGPNIYDGNGELVWSGACEFSNQNTVDFRVFEVNGTVFMSALLSAFAGDKKGHGIIMDSSYRTVANVYAPPGVLGFNMHEFNVINNGRSALHILTRPDYVDVTALGVRLEAGWIANLGFREVDIATGATIFEWWAHPHVSVVESTVKIEDLEGPAPTAWNWLHLNSVDKNEYGDYMLSARFTDCIYKISGKDGSIIWRLGGKNSSFVLDGFNFSRQHDARWLYADHDTEIISFLDNAADTVTETSSVSSALIVRLDKKADPMVARVVQRWNRPDGKLSKLRGNFQTLQSGNVLAGWSDNAYITEHTNDGRLLMEASFASERFVTYRAYKFNFTGKPLELPVLKAYSYGVAAATSVTVCYVSWNGATEVAAWNFYSGESTLSNAILIGKKNKTGFETMFQFQGTEPGLYVEGVDGNGVVLGRSKIVTVITPNDWNLVDRTSQDRSTLGPFPKAMNSADEKDEL